ncbi:DUF4124 domain-containing protein [Shewanella sp. M16]|uniref:DUF4124 domain-containing protein n=1 Tax=Shewanella sp. M16 TaxID=2830837 RepID=UPI001BAFC9DC|nr:DUF4124 domain-containing protein [Shewanella sp. M16]MBS0044482.1 DUF4124 domain-containing protein [Shewanella sp. M16]
MKTKLKHLRPYLKYLLFSALMVSSNVKSEIYKCEMNGVTSYSDEPCGNNYQTTEYATPSKITFKYGGSGCPSSSSWIKFMELAKKEDYVSSLKILDNECIWLEENMIVLGPIDTKTILGTEFILVKLSNDTKIWIDLKNHQ